MSSIPRLHKSPRHGQKDSRTYRLAETGRVPPLKSPREDVRQPQDRSPDYAGRSICFQSMGGDCSHHTGGSGDGAPCLYCPDSLQALLGHIVLPVRDFADIPRLRHEACPFSERLPTDSGC